MEKINTVTINNKEVPINGERNILELVRKANIDLPTFCYYSEMSIYGSCRLCMVDVNGRGILPACSTPPEAGMVINTNTREIRNMRKIIVELLLANHAKSCTTCDKGTYCQLQNLARRLGVEKVRFKTTTNNYELDNSSPSLIRDPNKCILCGDCVRMCDEVQKVGAIDFAFRGTKSQVMPSYNKKLDSVECVYCGQCSRVCPTGAITPKSNIEDMWREIFDKDKVVAVQIAPAVRVAIGEAFGFDSGVSTTNKIVAALKAIGVDKVYDTSFTADLTVIEEANEFLKRYENKERLPLFTSCCPAWVKFAEQYYPELLGNLSSCKSPQQMFGAVCKARIAESMAKDIKDVVMVSIMPCTAKKFEAARPEFQKDGVKEVDFVLTTQELIKMIKEVGIDFYTIEPESFDMPFGFKTGAGIIFGNSGGVTEAVLRYASEKLTLVKSDNYVFTTVRGNEGIKEATIRLKDIDLKVAIVSNLGNARKVIDMIKNNEKQYDFVEVMACNGGCIGGAGQPISRDNRLYEKRTKGIYDNDKMQALHKSQDNPYIDEFYEEYMKYYGDNTIHNLLHTSYNSRKRIYDEGISIMCGNNIKKMEIVICYGTGCFIKGAQRLLNDTISYINKEKLNDFIDLKTSFCFENCSEGPVARINGEIINGCTIEDIKKLVSQF